MISSSKEVIATDEQVQAYIDMIMEANFYDDEYVRLIFSDDRRAERAKLILTPFIGREINIRDVRVEVPIDSVGGRGIRTDVCAIDESGSTFDVEFQRDPGGAHPHRARFNSAVIDAHYPLKGVDTNELRLPETYVIFFTEKDYFKKGKPFYTIERSIKELGFAPFDDGSHIIYVNGEYDDTSTQAGKIIHDLRKTDASEMVVQAIAGWANEIKDREGNFMSNAIDAFAKIKDDIYQQGRLETYYGLVSRGRLTPQDASEEANMPVALFMEKMAEYNSRRPQA